MSNKNTSQAIKHIKFLLSVKYPNLQFETKYYCNSFHNRINNERYLIYCKNQHNSWLDAAVHGTSKLTVWQAALAQEWNDQNLA